MNHVIDQVRPERQKTSSGADTSRHHPARFFLDGTDDGGGISEPSRTIEACLPQKAHLCKVDILLD